MTNDDSELIAFFDIEEESKEGELQNNFEVKFLEFDKQKFLSSINLIVKKKTHYFNLDLVTILYKDIILPPPKFL